uniref:ABC transporter A family member 1 n=1 Tax=Rhizophora mucronata TaxID=61149 RepID=A0A2P2LAS5_RHIMU
MIVQEKKILHKHVEFFWKYYCNQQHFLLRCSVANVANTS